MLDPALLDILADPETKQPVVEAGPELIAAVNRRIAAGNVKNRGAMPVREPIDGGLLPAGTPRHLYPVRGGIPVMLVEEAIPIDDVPSPL